MNIESMKPGQLVAVDDIKELDQAKKEFLTTFPFRPLNGFLLIVPDSGGGDMLRGRILKVCWSLVDQVFPGDFLMYKAGASLTPLSFGKAQGALIHVSDVYGAWDAATLREIEQATQGRPGMSPLMQGVRFEL